MIEIDRNKSCYLCYQRQNSCLTTITGLPVYDYARINANFYKYYSNYPNKNEINKKLKEKIQCDKLVIEQKNPENKYTYSNFLLVDKVTDSKLKVHLIWSTIRQILNIEDFVFDIKNTIISFYIF